MSFSVYCRCRERRGFVCGAQKCIKSKSDANACICSEKLQLSVVAGTDVRAAPLSCDGLIGCCVGAAIRHVIAPVCTWVQTDIDDMCRREQISPK